VILPSCFFIENRFFFSGTIMNNIYTFDEIARHNNANDLWIVINDVVYDITAFYKEHPGGEEVLLKLAGQDATECFENVGHSYEAINLREKFKIGEVVDGTSSGKSKTTDTGLIICFFPRDLPICIII